VGRGAAAWEVGSLRSVVGCAIVFLACVFASGALAAPPPVVVRATFDRSAVPFAGAIHIHVTVSLDAGRVRPDSLRLVADPGPLTALSPARTARTSQGHTTTTELTRTVSCLSSACVATSGDATPELPPVRVTVLTPGGAKLRASAAWPTLHVQGRVSKVDLGRSQPRFRANTAPALPSYRIAPSTLAWLLDGVAIVLALGGAALAVYEARRFARRRRTLQAVDELARAIRLAHEAENRPSPDRRRALGLLARLLDARDRRLSGTASELAWAKPQPEREALATFVGDVEREVPS
jgi:hypothetical protein